MKSFSLILIFDRFYFINTINMKKIIAVCVFSLFAFSMNAQEKVELATIKADQMELKNYADTDLVFLNNKFTDLTTLQKDQLAELFYFKYKVIYATANITDLTHEFDEILVRFKSILGEAKFAQLTETNVLILVGKIYLN